MKKCLFSISMAAMLTTGFAGLASNSTTAPAFEAESMHGAIDWCMDSAERKAIYREIFSMAPAVIMQNCEKLMIQGHGKDNWGVIFDIDETILDNWQLDWEFYINGFIFDAGIQDNFIEHRRGKAEPGVINLMKTIKALGGYVTLVTGRDQNRKEYDMMACTKAQLTKAGILEGQHYDQILLWDATKDATGPDGSSDKNSRFKAVSDGNLKNPRSSLPAQHVVAYFGDNIQDFPNSYQNNYDINMFGSVDGDGCTSYFCLPNPMYGSWTKNAEPILGK